MAKRWATQAGFTIVELLIVVVVIGILATITIVAYSNIQRQARDSVRTADIKQVQKAIELYYVDNGYYPSIGSDNAGYDLPGLLTVLSPKYLTRVPADPLSGNYQYVRGASSSKSYGIRVNYETKTPCHLGVKNAGIGWWSLQACE